MARPSGKDYTLKTLLATRVIEIPEYQRTYDWNKKTVEQLLECLSEHQKIMAGRLQNNPYFLGNLMIHSESTDEVWYLVDGQQRLVTLTILSGLIRDLLCENGEYELAFELQREVIGELDAENRFLKPRDTLTTSSPRELLWPIQAPMDQVIEFNLAEDYADSVSGEAFPLQTPLTAKFPLEPGAIYEINLESSLSFWQVLVQENDVLTFMVTYC